MRLGVVLVGVLTLLIPPWFWSQPACVALVMRQAVQVAEENRGFV